MGLVFTSTLHVYKAHRVLCQDVAPWKHDLRLGTYQRCEETFGHALIHCCMPVQVCKKVCAKRDVRSRCAVCHQRIEQPSTRGHHNFDYTPTLITLACLDLRLSLNKHFIRNTLQSKLNFGSFRFAPHAPTNLKGAGRPNFKRASHCTNSKFTEF